MTRLDEIERRVNLTTQLGTCEVATADIIALVAIARKAIYVCAAHEDKPFFEYHASIDALSEAAAPMRLPSKSGDAL